MGTFGDRLRYLRKDRRMSITELSAALGLSYNTIRYYEKCKRKPDIGILSEIAIYFDVTCDYLVFGREKKDEANII